MDNRINKLQNSPFTAAVLSWYNRNKRDLPWRQTQDPYLIWLSEIILQQTRVVQGLPYYNRFVERYPDVSSLARASEAEVLRLWQGLGYYSRARNLHKCANIIVDEHEGKFPETMALLLALPGIGRYTAAAIASLAYHEVVPVVDGNVYRVLARYFGVEIDIASSRAFSSFYELSKLLISENDPGGYNQAVMEFGALFCTPKQPDCEHCVLQEGCVALANSQQKVLPVKVRRVKSRARYFNYFIIFKEDKILMHQRTGKDIWQGLYEFFLVEESKPTEATAVCHPTLDLISNGKAEIQTNDKIIRHLLTHQQLNVNFVIVNVGKNSALGTELATDGFAWYNMQEVEELPKPVLLANFLDTYMNSINLQ
jgi:A/G-specific adenine glycosylase